MKETKEGMVDEKAMEREEVQGCFVCIDGSNAGNAGGVGSGR